MQFIFCAYDLRFTQETEFFLQSCDVAHLSFYRLRYDILRNEDGIPPIVRVKTTKRDSYSNGKGRHTPKKTGMRATKVKGVNCGGFSTKSNASSSVCSNVVSEKTLVDSEMALAEKNNTTVVGRKCLRPVKMPQSTFRLQHKDKEELDLGFSGDEDFNMPLYNLSLEVSGIIDSIDTDSEPPGVTADVETGEPMIVPSVVETVDSFLNVNVADRERMDNIVVPKEPSSPLFEEISEDTY